MLIDQLSIKTIHYTQCPLCQSGRIQKALSTKDFVITQEVFDLYDCQDCGLRFTQDVPIPAEIGRYYKSVNYISHSDTREGLVNRVYHLARRFMLKRKQSIIEKLTVHRRLLDVGSGTGYFLNHMRSQGYEVMGIEVDEDTRQYSIDQFNLDIHKPLTLEDGLVPGKFGIITMWHVLEHLYDPKLYLQRYTELLEKDGFLLIAVPNFTSTDAQHYQQHWAPYETPRHLWHFSPKTITNLLDEMGFQLHFQEPLPLDPFYESLLSEQFKGKKLMAYPLGFWHGLRSFLASQANSGKGSSVLYVFKLK
jgi:2-polyprenyl-3-methyl-5-hydroxy-6-metoxy-1,4-benzoquinol methylase